MRGGDTVLLEVGSRPLNVPGVTPNRSTRPIPGAGGVDDRSPDPDGGIAIERHAGLGIEAPTGLDQAEGAGIPELAPVDMTREAGRDLVDDVVDEAQRLDHESVLLLHGEEGSCRCVVHWLFSTRPVPDSIVTNRGALDDYSWFVHLCRLCGVTDDREQIEARLESVTAELQQLRFTLDVVGTIDLDTSLLNRNGIFEAIQRAQRWLARRGDIYGALYIRLPNMEAPYEQTPAHLDLLKHVAATISAGVRDVDDVGRAEDNAFVAVLADLQAGTIEVVANRVRAMLARVVRTTPETGRVFTIGGVEVRAATHNSGTVLDTARQLSLRADDGSVKLSTL